MKSLVYKYGSLFFLFLFLFPLAEKELHALEHSQDVHCSAKSEKHFHTEEHQCSICDFSLPQLLDNSQIKFSIVLNVVEFKYEFNYNKNITYTPFFNTTSRGPPIV